MVKIAALVLAAGRSSRFAAAGGREATKLVAPIAGKPLARYAVEAALGSAARPVVVVTGHAREAVEAALRGLTFQSVYNSDFVTGLASSLRVGIAALPSDMHGAVVLLADMPAVRSALIDRLIAAFAARPDALAALPVGAGRRGNPVLLSAALFPSIANLAGDEGARRLLATLPAGRLIEAPIDDIGATLDIDTPAALAAAEGALKFEPGVDH
jgi:molybdenum cofactor cytidylyltransferase